MKKMDKKSDTKDLVQQNNTIPATLIESAIKGGADLDKLEKLLDIQLRWEANEAKKAYVIAMSNFQADPPVIEKDMHVKFETAKGTVEYNHASLFNVTKKINAALSQHGLSAGWETDQDDKGISVTCKITHINGHSEKTTLKSASDLSGGKNAIQAIGSAVSYLQRYTLLSLTGLATYDMDDDGKTSEPAEQKKHEVDNGKSKPEEKPPVDLLVSTKQMDVIMKILDSHLLNNFEHYLLQKDVNIGMSKELASKYIDWWIGEKSFERKKRQDMEKIDDESGTSALSQYLNKKQNDLGEKFPQDYKEFVEMQINPDAILPVIDRTEPEHEPPVDELESSPETKPDQAQEKEYNDLLKQLQQCSVKKKITARQYSFIVESIATYQSLTEKIIHLKRTLKGIR